MRIPLTNSDTQGIRNAELMLFLKKLHQKWRFEHYLYAALEELSKEKFEKKLKKKPTA
jgi:hypothetical protein